MTIISLDNLPNAEQKFMEVSSEQIDLMKRLQELGAFNENFIFEEIEIETMADY